MTSWIRRAARGRNLVDRVAAPAQPTYDPRQNNATRGSAGFVELWLHFDGAYQLLGKLDNNFLVFAADADLRRPGLADALVADAESALATSTRLSTEGAVFGSRTSGLRRSARRVRIVPLPDGRSHRLSPLRDGWAAHPSRVELHPAGAELSAGIPPGGTGTAIAAFLAAEQERSRQHVDQTRAELARITAVLGPCATGSAQHRHAAYHEHQAEIAAVERAHAHLALAPDPDLRAARSPSHWRC